MMKTFFIKIIMLLIVSSCALDGGGGEILPVEEKFKVIVEGESDSVRTIIFNATFYDLSYKIPYEYNFSTRGGYTHLFVQVVNYSDKKVRVKLIVDNKIHQADSTATINDTLYIKTGLWLLTKRSGT